MIPSYRLAGAPVLVVFAAIASACSVDAGETDTSEAETIAAGVEPGRFTLDEEPNFEPNPQCDVHTRLVLSHDRGASEAALEEALDGFCERFVAPNPRTYVLRDVGTNCGSRIFAGTVQLGSERYSVRITDHRSRTCRDVPPAQIVVEEIQETSDGERYTTTRYSRDSRDRAAGCDWFGEHHPLGASFPDSDGCNTCTCKERGITCTERLCPSEN
jgi:hypothetical protein